MDCKNCRRQPRAWNAQARKNPPNEQRVGEVEKDIYPMITGWIQVPERALHAQDGVSERKILRRRIERKPNPTQTIGCDQEMITCYITVIVPNESAVPCRPVDANRQHAQCECTQGYKHASADEGVVHSSAILLNRLELPKRFRKGKYTVVADRVCFDRAG